ncbi:sugar phosphate isomerase/epimerase family protein [Cohnella zeiphila]|uniref:Sugar phosphate isomerase/epimerase n=1 Tax=Cohnella zeiphila TaxID=2761120 RepID=A0A7X0SUP4_9BACL|nr:TIM barrel protein [Cohnella zeiphila]MBB6734208.1 sugar phosphate isomerase/epimerase [Cohnella zeiphila]
MFKPGLISITFRQLPPERIIELAVQAGLKAIEWGGDIHVPHGDPKRAEEVGFRTRAAGLETASYGSYYRVGNRHVGQGEPMEFERVLETAEALGAPAIRVWAGDRGSASADEEWRALVAEDARRIADLAAAKGISIGFEYHGNTLTDTAESAVRLYRAIDHPNVRSHWQPQTSLTPEQNEQALRQALPWLANLHVFQWLPNLRCPLADGQEEWRRYFAAASEAEPGGARYALMEFVKDDDPEQFLQDAAALHRILAN